MDATNRQRSFVLQARGKLIAHTVWRPFVLCSRGERIRAAGIGLVTTHRDWRKRGCATQLVRHCVHDAQGEGAEIAILFGSPRGLYARLGFVPVGRERLTRLEPGPEKPEVEIRPGTADDVPALLRLLEQHPVRVERSAGEFERLLAIPRTHVYVLETDGELCAYCIEGKGRDLEGVVHEWAGSAPAVRRLLEAVVSVFGTSLWLLSPECLPCPVDGEHELGTLGQVCILDASRFGTDDPREVFGDPQTPARLPVYVWGLDSV